MVPEALPRKKDEERIQRRPPQGKRQGRQRIRRKTLLQEKGRAGPILPLIRKMLGKPKDNGRTVNGKINHGMTGPGTSLRSLERTESPAAPRMEQPSLQMCPERYHNCYTVLR